MSDSAASGRWPAWTKDPAAWKIAPNLVDSMDTLNFVIGLHRALDVDIPEADYTRLATLDQIAAYLATGLAAKSSQP